jgi:hypothetical protein
VNLLLRTGEPRKSGAGYFPYKGMKDPREAVARIDKAIAEQPPLDHAITVFRGANGAHFKDTKPGDTLTDKGYMSASLAERIARGFQHGEPTNITITVPKGMKVLNINGARNNYNAEEEVIFPRGTRFRVESVISVEHGDGMALHLHAIPPDA